MPVDMTENIKVNGVLTRGLLHNTAPGFKLAGALAYAPIMTPVSIMGVPVPVSSVKAQQDVLTDWISRNSGVIDQVHVASHGDGTIWVWPYYDAEEKTAKLELILDDHVSDILRDVVTKKITEIIVTEQISVQTGFNQTKIVDRVRSFRADRISDTIDGRTSTFVNPFKMLPVYFANEPEIGRIRGHSDLGRIIPDLKVHHDVRLKWVSNLTKMNPKLVQEGGSIADWMVNNGYASLADIDSASTDFIYNKSGLEKTSYLTATGLGAEYMQFLQQNFWQIVQGSSIPELAWGLLASGNHASTEEQMERLMSYCRKKQNQHTGSWAIVFSAILALESRARMAGVPSSLSVQWNRLDALSEKTKSEIFQRIADAVAKMTAAAVPGEIIHNKLKDFYPDDVMKEYQEFRTARQDAAKFKAFSGASYTDILDAEGQDDFEDNQEIGLDN